MTTKLVGTGTMKYDDSAFYSKCDNMTIIIASFILHILHDIPYSGYFEGINVRGLSLYRKNLYPRKCMLLVGVFSIINHTYRQ